MRDFLAHHHTFMSHFLTYHHTFMRHFLASNYTFTILFCGAKCDTNIKKRTII